MPSLRELQRGFAARMLDTASVATDAIAIYRNAVLANYRNALAATFPVTRALTGAPFFAAAADAFALAQPSASGDLNSYGAEFPAFLAADPPARELPYVADVARLEWAVDDAYRAADGGGDVERTLAALATVAADELASLRLALDPSCRLLRSPYPLLRIWQVHQPGDTADPHVAFDTGADYLLVRRADGAIVIERLPAGDHAWLSALRDGADLAQALDAALAVDAAFDLAAAMRTHFGSGTLTGIGVA
ncbi:MAG: DNA-binding domain-containing protein [Betaproteobacteria bacterium]